MVRYIFIILTFFSLIHACPAGGQTDNLLSRHFSDYELIDSTVFNYPVNISYNDYILTVTRLNSATQHMAEYWIYVLQPFSLLRHDQFADDSYFLVSTGGQKSFAITEHVGEEDFFTTIYDYEGNSLGSFGRRRAPVEPSATSSFYIEPCIDLTCPYLQIWDTLLQPLCDRVVIGMGESKTIPLSDSLVAFVSHFTQEVLIMNAFTCDTAIHLTSEKTRNDGTFHSGNKLDSPVGSPFFAVEWATEGEMYRKSDFAKVRSWRLIGNAHDIRISPDNRYCAAFENPPRVFTIYDTVKDSLLLSFKNPKWFGRHTYGSQFSWSDNLLAVNGRLIDTTISKTDRQGYATWRTMLFAVDPKESIVVGPEVIDCRITFIDLGPTTVVFSLTGDRPDSTTSRIEVWQRK